MKVVVRQRRWNATSITLTISLVLAITIAVHAQIRAVDLGIDVIGHTLVDSEFPPPDVSPFFLKPATILMALIIVAWYCIVELTKDRVRRETGPMKKMISIIFLLTIILSFYEVVYNFIIWNVMLVNDNGDSFHPDDIANTFPTEKYSVNLVFATKSFVTLLGCSLYGFYVFNLGSKGTAGSHD
jgi:hypothetical protein